jgi:hypothetical protein
MITLGVVGDELGRLRELLRDHREERLFSPIKVVQFFQYLSKKHQFR